MSHEVEKMAYAGQTPWHGLGEKVSNDLTPKQMLKAAGLDWTVSKAPVYFDKKNGKASEMSKIDGKFALIRDTDQSVLSMVGATYKPVQNEDALGFFKQFTEAGKMTMETAGSLWHGRYIWSLAKIGKGFKLGKDDDVESYLLLSQPHVHGKSLILQYTSIRVVCWNTLNFALGYGLKGKAGAFRMPHSQVFNDATKDAAKVALGLAGEQMESFQEAATLLSKKKAKPEAVLEFFHEVLKFDPEKATKKKKDAEVRVPRMLPKFQEALLKAPGQDLGSAKGTWWGALNAVSYVIDHETGGERETALKNAWHGHTAGIKRRAFALAVEKAK